MSSQFWRICKANALILISVYALFPILALRVAECSDVFLTQAVMVFVAFLAGRLFVGPFTSYLVDNFKRKYVCIIGSAIIILTTFLCLLADNLNYFLLLACLQGVAYGIVSSSLIVLSTDLVATEKRNRGNVIFGWFTRGGMFIGIALGSFLYFIRGFDFVVYMSLFAGTVGIIYLIMVHVPFRAPIGTSLISLDRFFLPRSWMLVLNLVLVAIVPGIFIPLVHYEVNNLLIIQTGLVYPFFVFLFIGFLLAMFLIRTTHTIRRLIAGLGLLVISVSLFILSGGTILSILSALLLGASLALISPVIQLFFIDLSSHCERVSANVTSTLSWDIGIIAGIVISCCLKDNYTSIAAYQVALFSATIAFVFFVLVSLPIYRKRKTR